MNQQYFVLEFAHSVHGRVKRIHISYKAIAWVFGSLALTMLITLGMASSYLHMFWKVSNYNQLRADFDHLRTRYQDLQRVSRQHNEQMASLASLANEVSVAYGMTDPVPAGDFESPAFGKAADSRSVRESVQQYNFLRTASFSTIYHRYAFKSQNNSRPSLWPVEGVVRSSFGERMDPFSGEGMFHTGIDISAAIGTQVRVTADGVVVSAGWAGGYGKLVVVDHGNGLQTYYAHLSRLLAIPGQEVQRGEVIALSGGTGHATGPHVHYEIRIAGTPVNPYRYLAKPQLASISKPVQSDLGL